MADDGNITLEQLKEFVSRADERLDAIELGKRNITPLVPFTIPTEGWSTDDTYSDFPNCIDISVEGLLATDLVAVDVLPGYERIARTADFMQVESSAGKFRLRAAHIPSAAIQAQYRIISTVVYVPID